jgi:phosphoesterase RecJ-like protein
MNNLGAEIQPQFQSQTLFKLKQLIETANKILIFSHENPDPDAFGSAAGMGLCLRKLGKEVLFINPSDISSTDLDFIATVSETIRDIPVDYAPDAVFMLDCGDISRVGDNLKQKIINLSSAPLVNIDHHISNDLYGSINIVDTAASSTAEIIVALISELNLPIDAAIASALYCGILADSGSFRYSCVRPYTFMAALTCVKHGAEPALLAKQLYSRSSLERVKLHATALQKMSLHCQNKLAFVVVNEEDYVLNNASSDDCEGLAEKARDIAGVIVSVLIKKDSKLEDGQEIPIWKISMRSKSDLVDLSSLAQSFGGGGHKAAAAFRYRKDLSQLQSELLRALEPILSELSA